MFPVSKYVPNNSAGVNEFMRDRLLFRGRPVASSRADRPVTTWQSGASTLLCMRIDDRSERYPSVPCLRSSQARVHVRFHHFSQHSCVLIRNNIRCADSTRSARGKKKKQGGSAGWRDRGRGEHRWRVCSHITNLVIVGMEKRSGFFKSQVTTIKQVKG